MNCKCVEIEHGHQGFCNAEITFRDSNPINYYDVERVYGKGEKGERIVIDRNVLDSDKERCCDDCYDKIKNKVISSFKIDKQVEEHPLGAGFVQKDIKEFKSCEICGEPVKNNSNSDVLACDKCNDKYPI